MPERRLLDRHPFAVQWGPYAHLPTEITATKRAYKIILGYRAYGAAESLVEPLLTGRQMRKVVLLPHFVPVEQGTMAQDLVSNELYGEAVLPATERRTKWEDMRLIADVKE